MKKSEREEQLYFLTGMDQFNRSFSYLTDIREKKKVGMFFWLWIGQPYAAGAYDAGKKRKILDMENGQKRLLGETSDISPTDSSILG